MAIETSQLSIQVKSQGIVEATKALDELSKAAGSVDKETRGFILSMGKASQENSKAAIASAKLQTELLRQDQITAKIAATTQSAELAQARAAEAAIARQQKVTEQAERAAEKQAAAEARAAALDEAKIQRMGKLQSQAEAMNRKFDEKAEKLDKVNSKGNVYVNTLRSMATAASAYLGVNFLRGIVEQADAWGMMQSKLSLAVGSMTAAKAVQGDLFDMSQRLRIPLEDTVKLYTRMSVPLEKMGKSTADTKTVVESFSTALKLAGATGQEAASAMLQFSQSINAGRLNGGEFNSIAEASPNVLRAIEAELIRTGKGAELASKGLKKMASDGKLTTDVLVEALKNAAPQWKKDFESLPITVDGALTRIKNAWAKAIGEVGQNTKFNEELAKALRKIEDSLPAIATAIGNAFTFLVNNGDKILAVFAGVTTSIALFKVGSLVSEMMTAYTAIDTVTKAAGGLTKALAVIGITPLGAAIAALGLVIATVAYNWDSLTKSVTKVNEVNKETLQTSGKMVEGIKAENAVLEAQIDKLRVANEKQEKYNSSKLNGLTAGSKSTLDELARGLKVLEANLKDAETAQKNLKNASIFDPSAFTKKTKAKEDIEEATKAIEMQKRLIAIATAETSKNEKLSAEKSAEQREKDAREKVESIKNAAKTERQILDEQRKEKRQKAIDDYKRLGYEEKVYKQDLLNIEKWYQDQLDKPKEKKTKESDLFDAQVETYKEFSELRAKAAQKEIDDYNKKLEGQYQENIAAKEQLDILVRQLEQNESLKISKAEQNVITAEENLSKLNAEGVMGAEIAYANEKLRLAKETANVTKKLELDKQYKDAAKELDAFLDDTKVDKFSEALKSGFKGAASAFAPLIKALDTYAAKEATIARQRANLNTEMKKENATAEDRAKWASTQAAIDRKETEYKLASYGDLASAAKGFFKEGTDGYKTMATIEKIFRAVELADTIRNYATKSSLLTAFTGLFVASKATETAVDTGATATSIANSGARATADGIAGVAKAIASMPFPLNIAAGAATIAALMAIGVKLTGGVGNGAVDMSKQRQEAAGTGSVLGNGNAKSESFLKSLEYIGKVSDNQLSHTISMDNSLKTIVSNISGLSNLVVKAGGGDLAAKGIKEGTETNGLVLGVAGDLLSKYVPFIGNLMNKLFGTTTKVLDQGIVGSKQTFSDILKSGVSASSYADVNTTKKFLGMTYSDKTKQTTAALPSDVTSQFTMVVKSIADGVTSAAGMIGITGSAFTDKLNSFVVDIGNISTKGLTGDQIQKQFETVFSKIGDDMAKWTVTGLEPFQKIGEGAFETLIRVSTNLTAVNDVFANLKLKTFELSLAGAKSSEAIVALAGSLDNFKQVTSSYYENFYSEAERSKTTLNSLSEIFKTMGYEQLPATRDEFRKLVEQASELGDSTKAYKLMQLSDAFASVIKQTEDLANVVTDASTIRELEIKIMEMSGDAAGATAARRQIELSQLDATGQALQNRIYALTDEQAALQEVKQIQDEYAALVQRQAEAAAQLASKKFDLEIQILNLTGNAVEATRLQREKELASMDVSLRPLQSRIYALQDEKLASDAATTALQEAAAAARSIAQERAGLEKQLLQLQGNTMALRALEKGALNESNRSLQQEIYDLQDKQAADAAKAQQEAQIAQAMQQAYQAQQEAAQRAKEAYKSLSSTLIEEANKIMGIVNGNTTQSLGVAQSNFSIAAAQAKAGDQEAAKQLPELARTLLAIGENTLRTSQEFKFLQGATAGSLRTAGMYYEGLSNLPSFDVGTDNVPHDMIAQIHKGERIVPAAYNNENDTNSLKEEMAAMRSILNNIAVSSGSIDKNIRDSNRMLKQVSEDGTAVKTVAA